MESQTSHTSARPVLTPRLARGFSLACELHQTQRRKGSGIPFITHLMAVASLVGEYGGDEDQMIAALLHDAVEDQGGAVARERIREAFGDRVCALVDACSDTDMDPKPPWRERKEHHLAALSVASHEVRLIAAADKLHNVRSLIVDLRHKGEGLWELFKGKRDGSLWYYREALRSLSENWDHPILESLAREIDALHALDDATYRQL